MRIKTLFSETDVITRMLTNKVEGFQTAAESERFEHDNFEQYNIPPCLNKNPEGKKKCRMHLNMNKRKKMMTRRDRKNPVGKKSPPTIGLSNKNASYNCSNAMLRKELL